MRKRLLIAILLVASIFGFVQKANAVIGNPYWCYTGIATLPCWDGIYYGWVYCGMAQGEGYFYFYDGTVFHGNFSCGVPNGQCEVLTCQGYISGVWNNGRFVQTTTLPQQQIQQYYTVAQNNYYSTPQVQNNYRSTAQSEFALSDYNVVDVSDTQFGKQLMGKMK